MHIQTKYTKMVKWNRSTTGSVAKGIANKATEEKITDAEAQAMVIAKVANVLQAQNAEQMKNMMAVFEKLLASEKAPAAPVVNPPKTPRQPCKECPHCSKRHANHENAGNSTPTRPSGRRTGSPPRPLPDGARKMIPLSNGSWVR